MPCPKLNDHAFLQHSLLPCSAPFRSQKNKIQNGNSNIVPNEEQVFVPFLIAGRNLEKSAGTTNDGQHAQENVLFHQIQYHALFDKQPNSYPKSVIDAETETWEN